MRGKEREKEREKLMQLEVMQFEKDGKPLPPPMLDLMQFLKDAKRLPPPKLKEIPSDDEYISKWRVSQRCFLLNLLVTRTQLKKLRIFWTSKLGTQTSKKVIH
ncbi:hypothetical protein M6B38_177550 [Iris pallida]|uniref:Uncharacterized protein n=1 Tax=Iris pallida TaxID=29817 RepID=A0AAX6EQM1_IRIPA|nr:hypothetical protein M6B38_177550 [Iris pallida]